MTTTSQSESRAILRSLWMAELLWPNVLAVLVLYPLAYYGLPPLMDVPFVRLGAILAAPFLGYFLTMLGAGLFLGAASRSFGGGELEPALEEKLGELLGSTVFEGETPEACVVDRPRLALLQGAPDPSFTFVSTHTLEELSEEQLAMLLRSSVLAAESSAPWLLGRLYNFSFLIALVPVYTMHFTKLPKEQQPALLLACAVLGLLAQVGAQVVLKRWRTAAGDRAAAEEYGRSEFNGTLNAWAGHLRSATGSVGGYQRLARLSQLR